MLKSSLPYFFSPSLPTQVSSFVAPHSSLCLITLTPETILQTPYNLFHFLITFLHIFPGRRKDSPLARHLAEHIHSDNEKIGEKKKKTRFWITIIGGRSISSVMRMGYGLMLEGAHA